MNLYNEERKLKFMDEYPSYKNYQSVVSLIFAKASRYEREYDTDICNMTSDQLQRVFDQVGGLVVKHQKNVRSILASYIDWCKANGYCEENHINQVAGVTADKVRLAMVANPPHLKAVLDVLYDKADVCTGQYVYRALMWLAFIGFNWSDVMELKTEHIDQSQAKIIYTKPNGYTMWGDIPPQAVPDLLQACSLKTLCYDRGRYIKEVDRAEGDWIVRTQSPLVFATEDEKVSYTRHSIRPAISKASKLTKQRLIETLGSIPAWCAVDITFDTVLRSGVFCRHYELERAGLEVNLRNIYQARFASGTITDKEYNTFRYSYQHNYAQWKEAFT